MIAFILETLAAFLAGAGFVAVIDAVHGTRVARRIGRQAARDYIKANPPVHDPHRERSNKLIEMVNSLPAADRFVILGEFCFIIADDEVAYRVAVDAVEQALAQAGQS